MKTKWALFAVGWLLVLLGGAVAWKVQTSGGVDVRDVRVALEEGGELSALLYVPPNATEVDPAPAVMAVHGYMNSRETQSGFAIELARRGYVVLAIDQTGHGFSDGVAFGQGFGGPAGLAYLHTLPFVDADRIGLEGHSMGGWTVLAAAASDADGYASVALVGSSTGEPFAPPGTTEFPRNVTVVFSTLDEFSQVMWGVPTARDVVESDKLKTLFGTDAPVEPDRLYGNIEQGTGRLLAMPVTTHPGDHISPAAIADVVSWMDRTLGWENDLGADEQIWFWKELGTLVALVGGVLVLLGAFDLLIAAPWFNQAAQPGAGVVERTSPAWWISLLLALAIPALSYFPLTLLGARLSGMPMFPQNVTNQIVAWAIGNGLVALAVILLLRRRGNEGALLQKAAAAVVSAAALYTAVAFSDIVFKTDMRFWIVALKPLDARHALIALAYLAPFTAFFYVSQRALHASLSLRSGGATAHYVTGLAATAGGMTALVAALYAYLLLAGRLPGFADPLLSVIAIQFVAVLAIAAVIAVFAWRRTNGAFAGALMCGILITWYVVASQATHV